MVYFVRVLLNDERGASGSFIETEPFNEPTQQYDGRILATGSQSSNEADAIHFLHLEISDHQIDPVLLHKF